MPVSAIVSSAVAKESLGTPISLRTTWLTSRRVVALTTHAAYCLGSFFEPTMMVLADCSELGIDIGPVELVCQIGSPRSLATFLQRVGRSGHTRGATPKGRLYPTTRDELVECAALLRAVRAGKLDRVLPPAAPLDILAQQIVAAC